MKAICDRFVPSNCSSSSTGEKRDISRTSLVSDSASSDNNSNLTLCPDVVASSSPVSQQSKEASTSEHKPDCTTHNGWTVILKTASMASGAIRRFQERVLGPSRTGISSSTSEIWLLGVCYKISDGESSEEADSGHVLTAFGQDFSSLILMTYRRGFEPIGDTAYTSDVNWGCMLRSSQMLFAQALLFQRLGRSWRKKESEPPEEEYLGILELFGDSEASAFSIHNLILAGESYGLAAGSWVGPYAVCRSWESLIRKKREETDVKNKSFSMAVHIVSGSEDGERGGAPILCIEDVTKTCVEFSEGETEWSPILLLVPLVLGLDKVNPRYLPSLIATFTFPQSLGILGGKPGASTYIVGVQEDKGFYLDPHDVQQVVTVNKENRDVDTSSYHCNTPRYVPLESLDPSLALGFYCPDKADFDDFCIRATKLAGESNGAPLFTVTQSHRRNDCGIAESSSIVTSTEFSGEEEHEDDWQLL
ncbi:PREDICTED: cysteine protease ATG4b isoform X1 [Camelina sativa]|uniref:Cysteine protease n=2 Tax=Camelina sativa TaxID=90675 RepID=A0ABM0WCV4_CAMSA|nr:PREDICTED: cysteine protease ATG4b isoform X1 [Camelina sativa]